MAKKYHTSANNLIFHCVPDSTGVIDLLFCLTSDTLICLIIRANLVHQSHPNKVWVTWPWRQAALFFHLTRRQEHMWINTSTQPRGATGSPATPLIFQYLVKYKAEQVEKKNNNNLTWSTLFHRWQKLRSAPRLVTGREAAQRGEANTWWSEPTIFKGEQNIFSSVSQLRTRTRVSLRKLLIGQGTL